ncbi:hypothetical protein ACTQ54_09500 [Fundicoccus sp. Sow4_H7]|uniref:hypothetical protein n=1 Tax=Fundicoccus sp. Sow4_H7 TaxID=3438784 RepID=UPI003F8FD840
MANEVVYGVYDSQEELRAALNDLYAKNVTQANIRIVGSQELEKVEDEDYNTAIDEDTGVVMPSPTTGVGGNTSLTGETGYNSGTLYAMPVFIPTKELDSQSVDLGEYKKDLEDGKYLILLDEGVESRLNFSNLSAGDRTAVAHEGDSDTSFDSEFVSKDSDMHYDPAEDQIYDERLGSDADEVEIIEEPVVSETETHVEEVEFTEDPLLAETDVESVTTEDIFEATESDVEPHILPTEDETEVHIEADNEVVDLTPTHEDVTDTLGDDDTTIGKV